jgi:hypothetical protein
LIPKAGKILQELGQPYQYKASPARLRPVGGWRHETDSNLCPGLKVGNHFLQGWQPFQSRNPGDSCSSKWSSSDGGSLKKRFRNCVSQLRSRAEGRTGGVRQQLCLAKTKLHNLLPAEDGTLLAWLNSHARFERVAGVLQLHHAVAL